MAVTVHSVTSATMVQDTLGLVSLISQLLVQVVPMVQAKVWQIKVNARLALLATNVLKPV
jgi:hypothetical protein